MSSQSGSIYCSLLLIINEDSTKNSIFSNRVKQAHILKECKKLAKYK